MRATLIIAFQNLLQARRRTLLLGLAIVLVTMLLIVLGAVSHGFQETLQRNATALVSGHVNVGGWYKNKETDAWPMVANVDEIERIARENTPGLDFMVARDRAWAKAISRDESFYVSPSGIDIAAEQRLRDVLHLVPESAYKDGGRDAVLGDLDRLAEPHTALIFESQARRLGVTVGDYVTLTAPTGSGRTNSIDVTVVAVARDAGFLSQWNFFVPSADIHELYQTDDDTTSVVMLYLDDPSRAEEVMGHLREVFAANGYTLMDHEPAPFFFKFERVAGEDWTGQKLDITVWTDEVVYISWVTTMLDGITAVLIGILMAIIAIGIMNAMLMSVRKRTAEIGTARAIGMTRSGVLLMFVTEALLLGFFATVLGAALGAGLAAGLDAAQVPLTNTFLSSILLSDTLHVSVTTEQLLEAVVLFTLITGLSAISPAIRAARLQPVNAIQHTS
ncbi:MAG: ABC transporter permease [Deltaproteobacteria bacterium HGW-Deltaproteobacteria-14]|nr:MAG: ABC transporter permease [Deltaproteobacteria bacterium HGW-Deltaproteobacteria-14]